MASPYVQNLVTGQVIHLSSMQRFGWGTNPSDFFLLTKGWKRVDPPTTPVVTQEDQDIERTIQVSQQRADVHLVAKQLMQHLHTVAVDYSLQFDVPEGQVPGWLDLVAVVPSKLQELLAEAQASDDIGTVTAAVALLAKLQEAQAMWNQILHFFDNQEVVAFRVFHYLVAWDPELPDGGLRPVTEPTDDSGGEV